MSATAIAPDLARLPITRNPRAFSLIEGVRAALTVSVMIAASEYLAQPLLRESALAALWACLCDPGGPIRRRVPVLLSFTVIGALITGGFGLLRGLGPWIALPLGVLGIFAGSFVRVYGQTQQQIGIMLSFAIILALDRAMLFDEAAGTAVAFAIGALWATLVTLAIWRLYPYQATRQAVSELYRALAALAGDLAALLRTDSVDAAAWDAHARVRRAQVRDAIEAARDAVMGTLRGRGSGNLRASQSLIRLETGDQIFGTLVALSDLLEHASPEQRRLARRVLRRLRPLLSVLATVAYTDSRHAHPRIRAAIDAMEAEIAALPKDDPTRPVLDQQIERLRVAHTLAEPENFVPGAGPGSNRAPWLERLTRPARINLTWRSVTMRHAARTATMAAPALLYTMLWFTPYDHWLTITIVGTMQPFFAITYTRALERIAGTTLGGVVAAGVGLLCTTPMAIAVAMFPMAVIALAVRAVNFGLYMMALTPVVVLLVEVGQPDTAEWRIALARASLTVIGGVLAVAGNFVLWPAREPERLPGMVRAAIAAHADYADAVFGSLLEATPAAAVTRARREAGLGSNALEAAVSRALIERGGGARDMLEAVLVIDAALRRCAGRLSAMHLDPGIKAAMPAEALQHWRAWIVAGLRSLAAGEVALPPRPEVAAADAPRRIARQVELIAGAIGRLNG